MYGNNSASGSNNGNCVTTIAIVVILFYSTKTEQYIICPTKYSYESRFTKKTYSKYFPTLTAV